MHLSQDLEQRLQMTGCVMFELYRIMVSSFLIIFVPQKCGDSVCTYSENLSLEYPLYTGGLVVNFATMALFLFLYAIEIKRENRLITYLEVTPSKSNDNKSVGEALEHLSVERRENIWNLDMRYRNTAYAGFILFLANAILSGCVVYEYYLDGQTTTTYIT